MCYKCLKMLSFLSPISRSEVCPHCGADVRCCKNCKHYSLGQHYDCKEHVQEFVADKEKANFCDWFMLNSITNDSLKNENEKQNISLRDNFNSLFGE